MATQHSGVYAPVKQTYKVEKARPITEDEKKHSVFRAMRMARANKRLFGIRAKKQKEKEEEEREKAIKKK